MDYKTTLLLPETTFPMRAGLGEMEPKWQGRWAEGDLYGKIREARKDAKTAMVVHDGPPYANGDIHMGHVLNKVLKDIMVRFQTMCGVDSPFIPGWDCHGLPIETKVAHKTPDPTPLTVRDACQEYALRWVDTQKAQFQRLGCLGDWDNPYLTMSPEYERTVFGVIESMAREGLLERKLRPIAWCPHDRTALAEAELEMVYHDSPAIYAMFPTMGTPVEGWPEELWRFMAWTTTPWTLQANRALAVHPDLDYVGVVFDNPITHLPVHAILGETMASRVMGLTARRFEIVARCKGRDLNDAWYRHPFSGASAQVVLADFVTDDVGTSVVHIAPAYGRDDYLLAMKLGIEVHNDIDDRGRFTEGKYLEGEPATAVATTEIIKGMLKTSSNLYHAENFGHNYPHCWRCKKPTITRAVSQWFVDLDAHNLRTSVEEELTFNTSFVPPALKNRILGMVQTRPDWCISRQRNWGIPIPSVICVKCGHEHIDERTVQLCIQGGGSNDWFAESLAQTTTGIYCPVCTGETTRSRDILDVWFESGCSHLAIKDRLPTNAPMMVLEGTDQHRGWFQSSMICGIGSGNGAPFGTIVTHGFVLGKDKDRLAKSKGNSIGDMIEKYGADTLRLYVASQDFATDFVLSDEHLKETQEMYRKIRNTFRFILGNVRDFAPDYFAHETAFLDEDHYILNRLNDTYDEVTQAFFNIQYYQAVAAIYHFCNVDLSSFYFDVIKDRLYCDGENDKARQGCLGTLHRIYYSLTLMIAPILPHTADELWAYRTRAESSVHLELWPTKGIGDLGDIDGVPAGVRRNRFHRIMDIRQETLRACEELRKNKLIKSNQGASVLVWLSLEGFTGVPDHVVAIAEQVDDLARICGVSRVSLTHSLSGPDPRIAPPAGAAISEGDGIVVVAYASQEPKCPRCWNHRLLTERGLCTRCTNVASV